MELPDLFLPLAEFGRLSAKKRNEKRILQTEIADELGIPQSRVSRAESNPSKNPETAIDLVSHLYGLEISREPCYAFNRPATSSVELGSDELTPLTYHLRLLVAIERGAPLHISILQRLFRDLTAESPSHIDLADRRLNVGSIAQGAARALEDLFQDDLITFHAFNPKNYQDKKEEIKGKLIDAGLEPARADTVAQARAEADPGYQTSGCWWMNDGERQDLDGFVVFYTFILTQNGKSVLNALKHSVQEWLPFTS
jgi:transcriptional regulator with XRE-family HTH domain